MADTMDAMTASLVYLLIPQVPQMLTQLRWRRQGCGNPGAPPRGGGAAPTGAPPRPATGRPGGAGRLVAGIPALVRRDARLLACARARRRRGNALRPDPSDPP